MWKAKGATINFCEMLRVNLHLLRMLENLMTALKDKHVPLHNYVMYSCSFYFFFFHYFFNESSEALNELEHH